MANKYALPLFAVASNFSATTDIRVGSSFGPTNPSLGAAWRRIQFVSATACFISVIIKNTASTVLASAMLLPKTGSAALTANVNYIFAHAISNQFLYNYQLSAAITTCVLQVDECEDPAFLE